MLESNHVQGSQLNGLSSLAHSKTLSSGGYNAGAISRSTLASRCWYCSGDHLVVIRSLKNAVSRLFYSHSQSISIKSSTLRFLPLIDPSFVDHKPPEACCAGLADPSVHTNPKTLMFHTFQSSVALRSPGPGEGEAAKPTRAAGSRRISTSNACVECRRRKIRCDGLQPCGQCQWYQHPEACGYSKPAQRIVPSRK